MTGFGKRMQPTLQSARQTPLGVSPLFQKIIGLEAENPACFVSAIVRDAKGYDFTTTVMYNMSTPHLRQATYTMLRYPAPLPPYRCAVARNLLDLPVPYPRTAFPLGQDFVICEVTSATGGECIDRTSVSRRTVPVPDSVDPDLNVTSVSIEGEWTSITFLRDLTSLDNEDYDLAKVCGVLACWGVVVRLRSGGRLSGIYCSFLLRFVSCSPLLLLPLEGEQRRTALARSSYCTVVSRRSRSKYFSCRK